MKANFVIDDGIDRKMTKAEILNLTRQTMRVRFDGASEEEKLNIKESGLNKLYQ